MGSRRKENPWKPSQIKLGKCIIYVEKEKGPIPSQIRLGKWIIYGEKEKGPMQTIDCFRSLKLIFEHQWEKMK